MKIAILTSAALVLSACALTQSQDDAFFAEVSNLCGQTHEGQVISEQELDADWRAQVLVVGPVDCEANVIRMPLAIGADASRTWVLTRHDDGLEFRHEHVEPDGSPSPVTQYGGFSRAGGTATRQDFPADAATQTNFIENDIPESVPNVWTLTMEDGVLGYALARPETDTADARDFRAEFDTNG